jgi:hypothetical protein
MTINISESEYNRNRRLARIFAPYATQQIDEIYGDPAFSQLGSVSKRFVHYTTAEAALEIIKTKRFWMRNALCMADYREVQHGFDILRGFFADKSNAEAFYNAIDLCSPGAAKEVVDHFDRWLPDIRCNTYLACLSKHHDSEDTHGRLSMWRGFGGTATPRVAVVLKIPALSGAAIALNILVSPVAYLDEKGAHSVMLSIIENVKREAEFLKSIDRETIIGQIFNMLVAAVACLKHDGFKEEAEWRAIYSPNRSASPLINSSMETVGSVPQLVYSLPLDGSVSPKVADLDLAVLFDRLIIGPSPYPVPMWTVFVEALRKIGVSDAANRVYLSMIPIRGY